MAMTLETKQKVTRLRAVADGLRRIQEFESARYLDEYADHLTQPAQAVDAWAIPDAKPLPDLMMASYHEAVGWNAYREALLTAGLPTSPTDKDQR